MRARLIWVGKASKRSPEADLCARYQKRLQVYLKFDEIVIKPLSGGNANATLLQTRESDKILTHVQTSDFLVVCDERGRQLDSNGLARFMAERAQQSATRLLFCIGGSMGVSPVLRRRADLLLSLSKMTLPHAFARAMLWEQIYRACCINANHPYHHEG